jgi:hypothetical protein
MELRARGYSRSYRRALDATEREAYIAFAPIPVDALIEASYI